ncbi:hypothetical protein HU200_020085 [Digitaria exilis]|uniref:Bifunctional inhibitor/plant lipid transfer protein/seed storage helical domain-containing protein n=1 Tax=Digitaria exilis TaxID=1010633 RepID=A0A835F1B7_9POAL|nr:hypothetical protein HU200_020085 [Digitaria exilis]CAB3463527.1 unnamed protein product [Digitaria exilis]
MASYRCHLLLSAAVLLAAVLAAAAAKSPSSCVEGQAIPRRPLPGCRWYAASQTCGGAPRLLPAVMKQICCRQLEAVPAECRCKALRVMMEDTPQGAELRGKVCWHAQAEFAPAIVTEAECGLTTVHGRPFCDALSDE